MKELPPSKWYWRFLRWTLIVLAILMTLAALFVTEENWRAWRAWHAYQRLADARGDSLNWAAVAPPPVPDDQNFFAAPVVARELQMSRENAIHHPAGASMAADPFDFNLYRGNSEIWPNVGGSWQRGTLTDLTPWQNYFRAYNQTPEGRTDGFSIGGQSQTPAADVLKALSPIAASLEELRQASLRPQARPPMDYAQGFESLEDILPWFAREKRCVQTLHLRILAELQSGQSDAALADAELSLRLTDSLRSQPFLISHLVRIALMNITLESIYEGISGHCWNDRQLADLQSALAAENFLADYRLAIRGERTCAIESFETQRLTRQIKSFAGENGETVVTNSLRWVPSAYFYQNELAIARVYDEFVLPLVDPSNQTVSVSSYQHAGANIRTGLNDFRFYTIQAQQLFPAVGKSVIKFAAAQTDVDLARVACALERYRLAHGDNPAKLDALAPQFIPTLAHDILTGQPLLYRPVSPGKFVLYSVGWNQKDDGGTVVFNKNGSIDREKGDWVWKN